MLQLLSLQTERAETLGTWLSLIQTAIVFLVFLGGLGLIFWRWYREKKGASAEELARLDKVRQTMLPLLSGAVGALVTNAEQNFGPGTGEIKKSAVLADLIKLLPAEYRTLFDADTLGTLIENGLKSAKKVWNSKR